MNLHPAAQAHSSRAEARAKPPARRAATIAAHRLHPEGTEEKLRPGYPAAQPLRLGTSGSRALRVQAPAFGFLGRGRDDVLAQACVSAQDAVVGQQV